MVSVQFERLSGSTKLFLDFICCSDTAFKYYKYDFRSLSSYINAAEWIDKASYDRETIVSILENGTSTFDISSKTRENIKKISRPDSLIVFAGQQVGLLLGPMYTVIKALTAYKVASKLETKLGRPVIPCFWMATDDHDFDEIKTIRLLNRAGECVEISYEPSIPHSGVPMADVILDDDIDRLISTFEENLIDTEFSQDIKSQIRDAYKPGRTVSEAFAGLFHKVLGDFGIVPVDPNYPGMKRMFAPIFREEIENHGRIFHLFESRSSELIDAGYHGQVHKTEDSLNLFINDEGRRNIIFEDGKFRSQDGSGSFTSRQLLDILDSDPERFSPNVCLRPVAQCFAFPTVCQIVGPSEAAYFAQIRPLFKYLSVPWPVIRPRTFATLIEPRIVKIFKKLSVDFSSLYNDTEHEISRVIREIFPPEIQQKAESIRAEVEKPLIALAEFLRNSDPESHQALEHSIKRIDHELNHLSKRLFAAHKKRHDTIRSQVRRAADFLFPCSKFQERVLSPLYFASKFGPNIFKKIEEKLDVDSIDHQIIEI